MTPGLACTSLGADLFESEVFGHERGAFTGGHGERKGLVEQAEGDTGSLDEIGETRFPLQAKLLRVLENGEFRRVGGGMMRRAVFRLDPDASALRESQPFPGNIRDSRNAPWGAAVHSDDGRISARQVELALHEASTARGVAPDTAAGPPTQQALGGRTMTLHDVEAQHARHLLTAHGGNRRAVAQALKVSERTLYRKLRRYGPS